MVKTQQTVELDKQVVDTFEGEELTREDMKFLFSFVEDTDNWKNPINRQVNFQCGYPYKKMQKSIAKIGRAITFFTGSVATVIQVSTYEYRFIADGYYKTIGA